MTRSAEWAIEPPHFRLLPTLSLRRYKVVRRWPSSFDENMRPNFRFQIPASDESRGQEIDRLVELGRLWRQTADATEAARRDVGAPERRAKNIAWRENRAFWKPINTAAAIVRKSQTSRGRGTSKS